MTQFINSASLESKPAMTEPRHTGIQAADLAELIGTFNEVTGKLESTHRSLRAEVTRLSTELTETKQQLRRAEELAALGEMAAGIAHEVRNPLGPIRLFAEALVVDLEDRPEQQGIASRIVTSVTRLNAVVTDVLNFSRELRLDRQEQLLLPIVQEASLSSLELVADNEIDLTIDEGSLSGVVVDVDDALFTQALANVIRNACEAAAEAPSASSRRVTVSSAAAIIRDSSSSRRDAVSITVSDTGTGIPDEVKKRIFNPFFTTRETGTGLGLPIVHRIVDAHGGRVEIQNSESDLGAVVGARVALVVPAPNTGPKKRPGSHADVTEDPQ